MVFVLARVYCHGCVCQYLRVRHSNHLMTSLERSPTVTVPRERSCSDINLSPTYVHQRPARNARVGHLCFLLKPYKFMALLLRDYKIHPYNTAGCIE